MKVKVTGAELGVMLESDDCTFVELNSVEGQIGIMEGHAPYTAMLYPGWLRIHTPDGIKEWFVRDGMVDVRDDVVEITVSHVFDPKKASREELEQKMEELYKRYGALDPKDVKENARVMKEIDWVRGCLDLLDREGT